MSKIDAWFPSSGSRIPSLHGYQLFSAICRAQPAFHQSPDWGLHTVHGRPLGDGLIEVPRNARFGLRLPPEQLALALALCGRTMDIGGHPLQVGFPEVRPLQPATSLSARMVTIKGYTEAEPFALGLARQLDGLGVAAEVEPGPRLVQRAGDHTIIGFALRLHGLSEADSLRLQEVGLGGRRHMGCGVLRPSRVAPPSELSP